MPHVDWYFDFVSPFSYLQSTVLKDFAARATLAPRPLLFAGLLNHWGNLGPAELPPKRTWTFEHCAWLAHYHGITLKLPAHHPFNPLPLLRLALLLGEDGIVPLPVVERLFGFVWAEGHLPTDSQPWQALLSELDVRADRIEEAPIKHMLRVNGQSAIAAGVFGVPSAVCEGHRFWGFDATEMLAAWLDRDPFFDGALAHAAIQLPLGPNRPRSPK